MVEAIRPSSGIYRNGRKVKAKEWVAERIGRKYIIPTLGVWERAEDVDFDALPDKFVIKCNHTSGLGNIICKDKSQLDVRLGP